MEAGAGGTLPSAGRSHEAPQAGPRPRAASSTEQDAEKLSAGQDAVAPVL